MRLAVLLLALLPTPLLAAPVPKEAPKAKVPNYFPCELGTTWEYECGEDYTVVEVTKVRHERDCRIVTFTYSRPSTAAKSEAVCRVTRDGVWRVGIGKDAGREQAVLVFPVKVGDSWQEEIKGFGTLVTVVREPGEVKVPAGAFTAVVLRITEKNTPANMFDLREYYADGVGRVMTTGYRPTDPPQVLKKFTPPPPR